MDDSTIQPYAAIGVTLLMVVALAGAMLVVAHVLGPKRHGPVKDSPYESGMPIIVGTERRFHIRFYLVAMLFLLFDVEVVFLWPWAMAFYQAAVNGTTIPMEQGLVAGKGFLLGGMGFFFALLIAAPPVGQWTSESAPSVPETRSGSSGTPDRFAAERARCCASSS